jgi:hypothetical protein
MKIPAVAIAAAFAGGILPGLYAISAGRLVTPRFLLLLLCACVTTLCAGFFLNSKNYLNTSATVSLLVWLELGLLAGCTAQPPASAADVLNRVAAGAINLKSPLRWHGRLSSEPAKTPWGYSVDVALSGVEAEGEFLPVRGGLRLGFTPKETDLALPAVHAGDDVAVLTLAHLPLVYRDAGAFNRREFLANQGIDLVATLRAGKLLEVLGTPRPRLQDRVARWRARLRQIRSRC